MKRRAPRTMAFLIAGFAWILCAAAASAAPPVVTDIRVGQHGPVTRLVFDVDQPVGGRVFGLSKPNRVVVDLPEVGWRLPSKPLPHGIGLLRNLRYGLFAPGTTRVVLETDGPVAIGDAFLLEPSGTYGYRFVLDLRKASAAQFAEWVRRPATEVTAYRPDDGSDDPQPERPLLTGVAATLAAFAPPPRKPDDRPVRPLVVLDPGHGGIDPGATGTSGTFEKNVTLAAARQFRDALEATGRYRVKLTRERDIFIPLRERVAFARQAKADLFISIHADAIRKPSIRGLSVYTLSEKASDKEAAELAETENKVDLIAGVDLSGETREVTDILIDLAQRETMNNSAHFASFVVGELGQETLLLRKTHRFAGFRVLKAPDIPSILIEMGFLSNRQDEKALRQKTYRAKLGEAVVRAVGHYFSRVEEASRP